MIPLCDIVAFVYPRRDPPWTVSETSWERLSSLGGLRGSLLPGWSSDWAAYSDGLAAAFDQVDAEALWIHEPEAHLAQLQMFETPRSNARDRLTEEGLGPFGDAGARALIRDAARQGAGNLDE